MSLHLPTRRALQAAAGTVVRPPTATLCSSMQSLSLANTQIKPAASVATPSLVQCRTFFWNRKRNDPELDFAKSVQRQNKEDALRVQEKLTDANLNKSIFAEELEGAKEASDGDGDSAAPARKSTPAVTKLHHGGLMSYEAMSRSTDPDPRSRVRWQRKMVMRMVKRRLDPNDRETRKERITRTERQYVSRGPLLHTSTKKLVHLTHQVAGKTLDEALVQMRFSKKRWAREILAQLDVARDESTIVSGMGLGGRTAAASSSEEGKQKEEFVPIKFQGKDGKWLRIDDPTKVYVDQAWVNRGPIAVKRPIHRARGRTDVMEQKTANITIVLKEEKTRIREHQERLAKKARRAPWVHLPNRPITAQRQHYSW